MDDQKTLTGLALGRGKETQQLSVHATFYTSFGGISALDATYPTVEPLIANVLKPGVTVALDTTIVQRLTYEPLLHNDLLAIQQAVEARKLKA